MAYMGQREEIEELGFAERRKTVRVSSVNLISYSQYDGENILRKYRMAVTANISRGGLKIICREPLPIGTVLRFSLAMKEGLIEVEGEVVHGRWEKDGYHFGVKFLRMSPSDKAKLKSFMSH